MVTRKSADLATTLGLGLWLASMVALPAPLAARVTLLAPFVIVPRLLLVGGGRRRSVSLGGWPALVAALPLVIAFALPAGPIAFALLVPWLVLCLAAATAGAWHGATRLPAVLHPRNAADLGLDVALGFLAVGAVFLAMNHLGARPLGFSTAIILLTGTHFHVGAFGLLTIASLLARRRTLARWPVIGLVVGFPITAAGFVLGSDVLAAVGALFVGVSGLAVAAALLTDGGSRPESVAKGAAGLALVIGMPLGIAWSWSIVLGIGFIGLELMVRTHGVLNAFAVLVSSLPDWRERA